MTGALIQQYRELHADGSTHFPGRSVLKFAAEINTLVRKVGALSLLDYGCGQAQQYTHDHVHKWWGVEPTLYDPAVDRYAVKPAGRFDGVICADVLEHVPEDEVAGVIDECINYARRFVFFSICCRPASRTLPDGKNLHVTLHDEQWWRDLVETRVDACGADRSVLRVAVRFTP